MDSLVYITTVTYICYNPACDEQTTATAYVKKQTTVTAYVTSDQLLRRKWLTNPCYAVCNVEGERAHRHIRSETSATVKFFVTNPINLVQIASTS